MKQMLPRVMGFRYGSMRWCHEVEFKDGQLWYSTETCDPESITTRPLAPTTDQWACFWEAVKEIGVWKWKRDYSCYHFLDGYMWELALRRKWRSVKSHGSNGYPGGNNHGEYGPDSAFARFLDALEQLTGVKWNR